MDYLNLMAFDGVSFVERLKQSLLMLFGSPEEYLSGFLLDIFQNPIPGLLLLVTFLIAIASWRSASSAQKVSQQMDKNVRAEIFLKIREKYSGDGMVEAINRLIKFKEDMKVAEHIKALMDHIGHNREESEGTILARIFGNKNILEDAYTWYKEKFFPDEDDDTNARLFLHKDMSRINTFFLANLAEMYRSNIVDKSFLVSSCPLEGLNVLLDIVLPLERYRTGYLEDVYRYMDEDGYSLLTQIRTLKRNKDQIPMKWYEHYAAFVSSTFLPLELLQEHDPPSENT